MATSDLPLLLPICVVQLLAVTSPGPSFLSTARTAVARSRFDGVKVALFFGAAPVRGFHLCAKAWIACIGVLGLRLLWAARDA